MIDTKRADGVYIQFERLEIADDVASPLDWMDEKEDAERIKAWRRGDFYMIGIQAEALINIVRNGHGTLHTMTSAGCWAIESDSGEAYLNEVFEQEKAQLLADIRALGTLALTVL